MLDKIKASWPIIIVMIIGYGLATMLASLTLPLLYAVLLLCSGQSIALFVCVTIYLAMMIFVYTISKNIGEKFILALIANESIGIEPIATDYVHPESIGIFQGQVFTLKQSIFNDDILDKDTNLALN